MIARFFLSVSYYSRIWMCIFRMEAMKYLEYRVNFVIRSFWEISYLILYLSFFKVIYLKVDDINGWKEHEIYFLIIFAYFIDNIVAFFFMHSLAALPQSIRTGTLDMKMLKPANFKFLISCGQAIVVPEIVNIVLSFILLFANILSNDVNLTMFSILLFAFMTICAIIVCYNLWLISCCLAFWWIDSSVHLRIWDMYNLGRNPIDLFSPAIRALFTYIIPTFVIINFPVILLLKGFDSYFFTITLFITVIFHTIGHIVLKLGKNRYHSASS